MATYSTLSELQDHLNSHPDDELQWPEEICLADDGGDPWKFRMDVAVAYYERGEQAMRISYAFGEYRVDRRG